MGRVPGYYSLGVPCSSERSVVERIANEPNVSYSAGRASRDDSGDCAPAISTYNWVHCGAAPAPVFQIRWGSLGTREPKVAGEHPRWLKTFAFRLL